MLPRVHPGMLRRARLHEMLDRGPSGRADGVGAALVTARRRFCGRGVPSARTAVVWMTLDAADEDPVRLWTHLATAVERLGEGLGAAALTCLGVRGAR